MFNLLTLMSKTEVKQGRHMLEFCLFVSDMVMYLPNFILRWIGEVLVLVKMIGGLRILSRSAFLVL